MIPNLVFTGAGRNGENPKSGPVLKRRSLSKKKKKKKTSPKDRPAVERVHWLVCFLRATRRRPHKAFDDFTKDVEEKDRMGGYEVFSRFPLEH